MTAAGCYSVDTVRVENVFPNPVLNLDKISQLCAGESRLLDAGKFTSYAWKDGSSRSTLSIKNTGIYFVTVTDHHGCQGSDTTVIRKVIPAPSGFLINDTAICSYETITIHANPGFRNYLWSDNSVGSSTIVNKPGVYYLQVADENNCVGKESIKISLKDCLLGFYIPNAFTPDNNGKNDVFKPFIFGNVRKVHFVIYNRFGQKIFESNDLDHGWNGSQKGMKAENGVYTWICGFQFEGAKPEVKKGTVRLIR